MGYLGGREEEIIEGQPVVEGLQRMLRPLDSQ